MKNTVKKILLCLSVVFMCCKMTAYAEEIQNYSIKDLKDIKITFCEGNRYIYTGKPIMPDVEKISYTDENGVYQEKTEGFEIIYTENSRNIDVGSARAIVVIDGYDGEKTINNIFTIVPGKITGFKVSSVSYNNNGLYWNETEGAQGYQIYRSRESGKRGSLIKTVTTGRKTSFNDKDVEIANTYYYTIRAYRECAGKRYYGDNSKQLKLKAKVAVPENVSAKRASYRKINIKWDKVLNASGYRIYRSESKDGTYTLLTTLTGGDALQYTDIVTVCGKTYYYKVAAYRSYDKVKYFGNRSGTVEAKTTPARIQFNNKTVASVNYVTLCWNRSLGSSGYEIYRSTKEGSGYKIIKTIQNPDTLKWKNSNLNGETVYYYKIRPYVTVGSAKVYGSYSSVYKRDVYTSKLKEVQKYTYVPYVSGGNTLAGWDCSGFTQWAMNYVFGIMIPRSSAEQAAFGTAVNKNNMSLWKPGDILVYSANGRVNHVALYLGNGKMMHALNSKYGTVIQDVEYYESWDQKNNLTGVRRCF